MTGFEQLLRDLANPDESFDDLRMRWEDDPYAVGSEYELTNRQVGIIIRGNLGEVQAELKRLGSNSQAKKSYIQVIT